MKRKQNSDSFDALSSMNGRKNAVRTSNRQTSLSKAFKVVDEVTRNQVQEAHLDLLEADNYLEEQENSDDEYINEDEEERSSKKKTKSKATSSSIKRPHGELGWRKLKLKNLHHILYDMAGEGVNPIGATDSNGSALSYLSIAAEPSKYPRKYFCSVCGYFACYTCTRCGMKFCQIKCQRQHQETRCLKFSA